MSAVDDVMPNAYEEPKDVVTGDAGIINGASGDNMFTYTYSIGLSYFSLPKCI